MTYRVSFAGPSLDKSLRGLSRDMDRAFGELFSLARPVDGALLPASDVIEDDAGWTLSLDLPGVRPDDVEVLTEDRSLIVRANRSELALKEGARRITQERPRGNMARVFRLPRTADVEQISASTEHGVLTLRIGKLAPAQPRRVPVGVTSESRDSTLSNRDAGDAN